MSIIIDKEKKIFTLDTGHSSYQMAVSGYNVLLHTYYGKNIGTADMRYLTRFISRSFSGDSYEQERNRGFSLDLLPQEYSGFGVGDFRVSSVCTIAENGSRSVDLRYVSSRVYCGKKKLPGLPSARDEAGEIETLEIVLEDQITGLEAVLLYSVYEEEDVITRSVIFRNKGNKSLVLEKAASMCIDFPQGEWDVLHFHGKHCMERQKERLSAIRGVISLSSRRGASSHQQNPFFILCRPQTGEDTGDSYGFMLMYSGNHKSEIEKDQTGSVRAVMGINDEGFSWKLESGDCFVTPECLLSYSSDGLNKLSQNYHRMIRYRICPPRYRSYNRPVLLNTWEAVYFDFNQEKILHQARKAAKLGIEMLILDDGWFGKRNDDTSGLGDWFVNEKKLEGGLSWLSEEIHKLEMKFGLWIEPEMINEDSELYQKHPEWVIKDPDRLPMVSRNQLVLDMSRQDVQDYLFERFCDILDHAVIEYIKWDMNRSLANLYSNALSAENQGEVAHRFVLGTYGLLERLTLRYPELMIEGCAGGGGRFDAGMLYYCPQIWCSDDTDAIARLDIQEGTSYGYPISTMGAHVSAVPNHQTRRSTPMQTRAVVAASGTFGYELNLDLLTEQDELEIQKQVEEYHRYWPLVESGIYFRLGKDNGEDYYTAWEVVSTDQKEALVTLVVKDVQANPELPFLRIKGLKAEAVYAVRILDTEEQESNEQSITGAALMNGGYVFPELYGDYPAVRMHLKEI